MIIFVIGTGAEAIKVAPIIWRLQDKAVPFELWLTMQHGGQLFKAIEALKLGKPKLVLPNGNAGMPLKSPLQAIRWLLFVFAWFFRNRRSIKSSLSKDSILIVHGDTMTTVVGVLFARLLGIPSAHVEAGLRSGNWRHPFPEELDRRVAGLLSTIDYVPTQEAVSNLSHKREVIYTHGNTVLDSVIDGGNRSASKLRPSEDKYAVCLLHRYELMGNQQLLEETLKSIAAMTPCVVDIYVDAFSGAKIRPLLAQMGSDLLRVHNKLDYFDFINEIRNAEYVITDSGGIQSECELLGVPTLVHRKTTEQFEGFDRNLQLSQWEKNNVTSFIANFDKLRFPVRELDVSPSDVIVNDLTRRGYARSK